MTITKRRSCEGKVRRTRRDAKEHARYMRVHRLVNVYAYRCKFCEGWHVGHRPRRRFQR